MLSVMLLVKLLVPRRHRLYVDHTHLGNCIFHEFFYPTDFWLFAILFSRIFFFKLEVKVGLDLPNAC